MKSYSDSLNELYQDNKTSKINIISTPVVTFQITEDCNLKCKYCYQTNKTHSVMSLETAKKFIDLLITNDDNTKQYIDTQQCIGVVLDFIGGEPLLQPKLIDEIVDYFRTQTIIHNHPWQYNWRISICSNGTLYFNPEVQELIKKYQKHLSLSITLDGNKEIHDACRIFPNGEGSYDKAIAAVRHYKEYWHGFMGSKVTFSPDNIMYAGNAIINLINEDYTDIHANCVFEKGWENKHATIFYNEMKKIANYILNNDLEYKINLSLFVENFFQPLPIDDTQNWCGGNARMLALGPDGNIYPCIRYMPSSLGDIKPIVIGNVNDGIMTTQEQRDEINELKAVNRINQSSEECINCPIAKGCSYCQAFNYQDSGNFHHRATYICSMHKARALANVYYWNRFYIKNLSGGRFKNYLPDEEALKIIDEKELQMLKDLENTPIEEIE